MAAIERWYENEDWDIWVRRADLACTGEGQYRALVDFAGPGSATRYHFFARLADGAEPVFTRSALIDGIEEMPVEW